MVGLPGLGWSLSREDVEDLVEGMWVHQVRVQRAHIAQQRLWCDNDRTFNLKDVDPNTCKCLVMKQHWNAPCLFCSAVVENIAVGLHESVESSLSERTEAEKLLSPRLQLCQDVLTGTAESSAERYSPAAQLSKHDGTQRLGHFDPLITSKSHHLKHLCKDECHQSLSKQLDTFGWCLIAFDGGLPAESGWRNAAPSSMS